jgi:hypothetical protein
VIAQWLATADEWVIAALLLASLFAAAEAGFRLARRRGAARDDGAAALSATMQASVLGLLALLLGFTFAAASARFDDRQRLLTDEANAIGTAFLRAQLLPEPHRANAARLLREYVGIRIAFHEGSGPGGALGEIGARTGRLQDALWTEARAAADRDPYSVVTGLFVAAVNDVFDVSGKQLAAVHNRVPGGIFAVLFFVALVAVGFTGYAQGVAERRNLRATLLVTALIGSVIILIVDLDRPATGVIRLSAQALVDLKASVGSQAR